jgi:hypothetical protein
MIQIIGCLSMGLFAGALFWATISLGGQTREKIKEN